jgi:hypothetical protein
MWAIPGVTARFASPRLAKEKGQVLSDLPF